MRPTWSPQVLEDSQGFIESLLSLERKGEWGGREEVQKHCYTVACTHTHTHTEEEEGMMAGRSLRQLVTLSAFRIQRVMNAGTQLSLSFLFSSGPQPLEWFCPQ